MKNNGLIICLLVITAPVFSQGPVSLGPKVGWNSNRLSTDYTQYIKDFKSGFQGGLFVSLYINRFYLQPEAYFSVKWGALEATFDDPINPGNTLSISQDIKLQTVDIPLLVGYKLLDLKAVRFRIWAGPVVSYVLDKDYTLSINGLNRSDRITPDDFEEALWSGQIGIGLDLLRLTVDVGYELGFDSFLTIHAIDDINFRNSLFYCSVGWRLL